MHEVQKQILVFGTYVYFPLHPDYFVSQDMNRWANSSKHTLVMRNMPAGRDERPYSCLSKNIT
jgi:hypothetical protein